MPTGLNREEVPIASVQTAGQRQAGAETLHLQHIITRDLVLSSKGTVENTWAGLCPCCIAWTSNPELKEWLSMAENCVEAGKDMEIARANPPHRLLLGVCTCKCLSRLQEHCSACLATTNHMCSLSWHLGSNNISFWHGCLSISIIWSKKSFLETSLVRAPHGCCNALAKGPSSPWPRLCP